MGCTDAVTNSRTAHSNTRLQQSLGINSAHSIPAQHPADRIQQSICIRQTTDTDTSLESTNSSNTTRTADGAIPAQTESNRKLPDPATAITACAAAKATRSLHSSSKPAACYWRRAGHFWKRGRYAYSCTAYGTRHVRQLCWCWLDG